jgi:NAD(P)-dependent dehydrogenase (short-subunit alcohol dehydrogenase family)
MKRLEQRIAIVTGAGQGIGRAIALGLAREGAGIVIADINEKSANKVKNEIEAAGGALWPYTLMSRTKIQSKRWLKKLWKHSGGWTF